MRWFTSDLHLGHKNIVSYGRPFADVDAMNAGLIDRWNSVVNDNDTVYVVGDLCMGTLNDTLPLASRLRGHKVLIPGNHDRMWDLDPDGEKFRKWVGRYMFEAGVDLVVDQMVPKTIGSTEVTLCHFPRRGYMDARQDERFLEHYPDITGWLLHGHTHNAERRSDPLAIHVGVDAWDYFPASEHEIEELINAH